MKFCMSSRFRILIMMTPFPFHDVAVIRSSTLWRKLSPKRVSMRKAAVFHLSAVSYDLCACFR